MEDFQEALGGPWVQEALGGLLARLDLLVLLVPLVRRRWDRLSRPLLPRALEALEVLGGPETNRNHSTQVSSPKLRATIFFA